MKRVRISKVISSGETGVGRAAIDTAVNLDIPYAGWCPNGGKASDMSEPPGLLGHYSALQATPASSPQQRTEWNVRDSDATLVLYGPSGIGCSATAVRTQDHAQNYCRPAIVLSVGDYTSIDQVHDWVLSLPAHISLNISGPSEIEESGIYSASRYFIEELLISTTSRPGNSS